MELLAAQTHLMFGYPGAHELLDIVWSSKCYVLVQKD